jgi:DNA mismatch repair ATPase MutS
LYPFLIAPAALLFLVNVLIDDRLNTGHARQARALELLAGVLNVAARVTRAGHAPEALRQAIAADLPAVATLRRRLSVLGLPDPLELTGILRAALLVRVIALAASLRLLAEERERLRRLHRHVGELDALLAIAALRSERPDARLPELSVGPAALVAHELRPPGLVPAVGNDLVLGHDSLVLTGSNMSGKSTFLRTLGLSAILAQSIHTVFGGWHASYFRVLASMRAQDDPEGGVSTYAAEVASIGRLVAAVDEASLVPALFIADEPFRGTNPTVRVPIVVAVLEYLARGHIVVAATHDLDVAALLPATFQRGHFREREPDDDSDEVTFDYRLQPGTARTTNAVTLLRRAGYPEALLAAVAEVAARSA